MDVGRLALTASQQSDGFSQSMAMAKTAMEVNQVRANQISNSTKSSAQIEISSHQAVQKAKNLQAEYFQKKIEDTGKVVGAYSQTVNEKNRDFSKAMVFPLAMPIKSPETLVMLGRFVDRMA